MVEEPVDPSHPTGPTRLTAYPVTELYNFVRADTGAHLDADQQEEIQSRILELGEKQTAGSLLRAKLAAERTASEKERRSGGGVGMLRVSGEDGTVTMSGGGGAAAAGAAGSASARGGGRASGRGGGASGDVDVGADSIDVLYGMIDGGAAGGDGGGGGGGGGSGDVLGDALESAGWGSSASGGGGGGGGMDATGTAASGMREFDVFGRAGAGDEAAADFDQDFGDDAGDMGEAADDGIDEAARAGVEADEVAQGEQAFDEDAFEEDDFLDAAGAGAGDGEEGEEDGAGEATTQQERERRMLERIAPGSTTGDAAAGSGSGGAAAASAGAASKASSKIGGTATASGAAVEEELFGPSSDEVTARAAKRARLETRYADPVTALRERVKRLLVAHGGRITVEVLNREFRKESHEKGQAFKDMLVSTLAALTYRTASAASGKHEFVQKGR